MSRDLLRPGELYATAAFAGGIVVTALWHLTALNHKTRRVARRRRHDWHAPGVD